MYQHILKLLFGRSMDNEEEHGNRQKINGNNYQRTKKNNNLEN